MTSLQTDGPYGDFQTESQSPPIDCFHLGSFIWLAPRPRAKVGDRPAEWKSRICFKPGSLDFPNQNVDQFTGGFAIETEAGTFGGKPQKGQYGSGTATFGGSKQPNGSKVAPFGTAMGLAADFPPIFDGAAGGRFRPPDGAPGHQSKAPGAMSRLCMRTWRPNRQLPPGFSGDDPPVFMGYRGTKVTKSSHSSRVCTKIIYLVVVWGYWKPS